MVRTDWRIELLRSHRRLFEVGLGEPEKSLSYPLCASGWCDVLHRLCARVETALSKSETFAFVRIIQQFGVLRVDYDAMVSDATSFRIVEAVNLAIARSACTCEVCGARGRLYSQGGGRATRCADHAAGYPLPIEIGSENVRQYRRTRRKLDMFYASYDREADTLTEISPPLADMDE
ncbi:hypothetical protein [Bradyrhizobium canariense]|uniref:Uncharacterized protein n=1 Tax=Bradyrhizobium canariense TaxID=255045 RepID=A0A1X3G107_9BRAD|nr:hypothetical protein [Bradyrhizobium canariense]OSI73295.1 hypothetical protein BSZ22_07770 [Bradyrhizobium canariense]OSI79017.1 hypothetical protein BSZ23_16450 [Bradyrhizobium canariense]OSI89945.1 hypothetical protein BSZ25_19390 [Bradyrhizobium canariense]OSI92667.1 hypothetical protein BSZ24_14375 [Bradyrhizobium canariense]OSJ08256.1 hypothetical protein BSZ16_07595 [Bradyrhizobium canariense]